MNSFNPLQSIALWLGSFAPTVDSEVCFQIGGFSLALLAFFLPFALLGIYLERNHDQQDR